MARGDRGRGQKHDGFREVCEQLGIKPDESWLTGGSTITTLGIEAVLEKISERNGTPPSYYSDPEKTKLRLIHKSIESIVLAIETINKITVPYRLEAFTALFINAWELILKAKIIQDTNDIFAIKKRPSDKETRGFNWCLEQVFPSQEDTIRMSLEDIYELRNASIHYFLPYIPNQVIAMFQAGIGNYDNLLKKWFNRSVCERVPYGMLFLIIDLNPDKSYIGSPILGKKIPPESVKFLDQWIKNKKEKVSNLPVDEIPKYYKEVKLSIALVNNRNRADVELSLGKGCPTSFIIEKNRDPSNDFPYLSTKVIEEVNRRYNLSLNSYDMTSIIHKHKVKTNPEYHYHSKVSGSPQYSEAFVDWIGHQMGKKLTFCEEARNTYRKYCQRKKQRS